MRLYRSSAEQRVINANFEAVEGRGSQALDDFFLSGDGQLLAVLR